MSACGFQAGQDDAIVAPSLLRPLRRGQSERKLTESPLFCARCATGLEPGKGEFYVVRIEAFADPTPPSITAEDLQRDYAAEIERLLASMREMSEQEALDQVYRNLALYLCNRCYRSWIEHPVR